MLVGQIVFHRTVLLVLYGTGGIGRTHRIECVGGTGKIPWDCPIVLHGTDGIGWTGFHRTVPLVLHVGPMVFHDHGKRTEFTELSAMKRN